MFILSENYSQSRVKIEKTDPLSISIEKSGYTRKHKNMNYSNQKIITMDALRCSGKSELCLPLIRSEL
jgi:hypothetical protein